MRKDQSLEGQCTDVLRTDIRPFLGRCQQRVQHLDGGLEHFDEFHQALGSAVQGSGVAVGIRIVLAELLQLANVEFPDECGDILVVFVAGFRLGDADLAQSGGIEFDDGKLGNVAIIFVQPLGCPR